MWHSTELLAQEKYKELLREAEHLRLIQAARLEQPGDGGLLRQVVGWIGAQMVRWGSKLQRYGTPPPSGYPVACDLN